MQVCVASGKVIKHRSSAICCKTCKQFTSAAEQQENGICAMCHSPLPLGPSPSIRPSMSYIGEDMEE